MSGREENKIMIISQVIGGLGNQMFQYSAGRALSIKRGIPFKLDISGFDNYGLHQGYELHRIFDCPVELAGTSDIREVLGWQSLPFLRSILSRKNLEKFRQNSFIVEPHFHYWQGFEQALADCYLVGYWQTEKYFQEVKDVIHNDFAFKAPLSSLNSEFAEHICRVNAVSIHVRRGDYVSNPKTGATHGLCSLDYYRQAIRYLSERVEQPVFFVFSDDMDWVKGNLKMTLPCRYVDHNHGTESYNDMRLMSMCKHHIIANSSFSWWGAWLNPDPEKIVVAPKKWFANDSDVNDLFPQGWVTL